MEVCLFEPKKRARQSLNKTKIKYFQHASLPSLDLQPSCAYLKIQPFSCNKKQYGVLLIISRKVIWSILITQNTHSHASHMSHKLQGYYKITLVAKWNFIKWNFVNNFFNSPKKALGTFFRKHFTKGAPNVKFGTKWLHKIKIIFIYQQWKVLLTTVSWRPVLNSFLIPKRVQFYRTELVNYSYKLKYKIVWLLCNCTCL